MNKGDFVIITKFNEIRFLPANGMPYANSTDTFIGEVDEVFPDTNDCEVRLFSPPARQSPLHMTIGEIISVYSLSKSDSADYYLQREIADREIERCKRDPIYFIEHYLWIKDDKLGTVERMVISDYLKMILGSMYDKP